MDALNFEEIIKTTGGELLQGSTAVPITGFSIDTRTLNEGEVFVALKGEQTDGHEYVLKALEKGASGALVSHLNEGEDLPLDKVIIRVEDPLKALQQAAKYYREKFPVRVIGVTGSSGKTTTKDLIAGILSTRFNILKTEGNLNNHLGLPLMLFKLKRKHQMAVLEMGMSGRGEIRLLADLSHPEIGVITNIGEAHFELLGSVEAIAEAKGELLEVMNSKGTAILNGDDYRLRRMANKFKGQVIFYGLGKEVDCRGFDLVLEGRSTSFKVLIGNRKEEFTVPFPGEHNVYNALAAISCGLHVGLTAQEIRRGLADFKLSGMRMEIFETPGKVTVINDAYNANLSSTRASLKTLALMGRGSRLTAVLGDMLELGSIAEESHREIGRYAASLGINNLLAVGELMKFAVEEAQTAGLSSFWHFARQNELKEKLREILQPGDYVLVKGSRGMKMENIVEYLKNEK
ncbi:MAG: UDP-N-acetylmuramoyl-tripeptide--D-alanyl-D-alanine ligase [Firmicutes bacterium HGW-Firmicutes-13]|nr:MAG: UDP-N-acetylmuramoyl-tripeptide--D-alanyl-D-alanine ligase [Firmicutes bacterium HGW-Firmicutes-13]